jgi:hypothetical protein
MNFFFLPNQQIYTWSCPGIGVSTLLRLRGVKEKRMRFLIALGRDIPNLYMSLVPEVPKCGTYSTIHDGEKA